jgi:hypothetical protein
MEIAFLNICTSRGGGVGKKRGNFQVYLYDNALCIEHMNGYVHEIAGTMWQRRL